MSALGGERAAVQNPILQYVQEIGWGYVKPDEAIRLRGGERGFIFREVFIDRIQELNPGFMDNLMAEDLINNIERIPPGIEGNQIAWEYIRGLRSVYVPYERRERNVKFIDYENIDRNVFQVTDEFKFTNGSDTIRPDIVFLINGVPVIIVETKAAHKKDAMEEAWSQLMRYHREGAELMTVLQVYSLTHLIKFYYGATWNFSPKFLFTWKTKNWNLKELITSFFSREQIVRLVLDYILFVREDDELKKAVFRPHQIRGVEKIVERAKSTKKRGLIWHTQGSGKTYTMIVAAKKLIENPIFENPTVIMVVDRNELEAQLFNNLAAVGFENVKIVSSKRELKETLKGDRRGLVVTMIHKFDKMPPNINTRSNIFVLIDEAHRTTGGDLGNYMMGALPNATYIGFTGTPIDRTSKGKGTFVIFGRDDPPHGYLDKYSIAESIEDGTTVPLHYALAPNDLLVNREILEKEFLDMVEGEGMSDVEELNRVLEKAVNLKNELKNEERMMKIAKYVAEHYRRYVEPMGYKAFFVAVDREACAIYKELLDKYFDPKETAVVFSPNYNDPEELKKYHLSEEKEKQIRKDFRIPDKNPKILIVTQKLLTGFDAPILYCMYLDKPMRDHVLLQTIARVNRPYDDEEGRKKTCGFILDFVGIFGNLKKALSFDSTDIEGVVKDIETLKDSFKKEMKQGEQYITIIRGKSRDLAVEAVLKHFMDEDKRQEFYEFFNNISTMYEVLSPDPFLRPYINDVETLAQTYRILKEAYEPTIMVDKEFTRKTAELVRKNTASGQIKGGLDIYEINGNTIKKLQESNATDTEKVFNLIVSIEKTVKDKMKGEPYLISIGEKAERIAQMYRDGQKYTEETLEALKDIIEDINRAREEKEEKNLPTEAFTIYWVLRKNQISEPEKKANFMKDVLENFPHWKSSERQWRAVKKAVYKTLLKPGVGLDEPTKSVAKEIIKIMGELRNGLS